jgi:hypothetical protein
VSYESLHRLDVVLVSVVRAAGLPTTKRYESSQANPVLEFPATAASSCGSFRSNTPEGKGHEGQAYFSVR